MDDPHFPQGINNIQMDESKFYTEIEQHNDDYKVQSIL